LQTKWDYKKIFDPEAMEVLAYQEGLFSKELFA
jgi:hypothetical protein